MKKIIQVIVVLLFGFWMFFVGYQNNVGEKWEETYGLPDSGMALQFTEDGQLNTIVSGFYRIEETEGDRYLYMAESDEENLADTLPYLLCVNDDNTIILEPQGISGTDHAENLSQTLQYVSGTDGLTSGIDIFEGKYKDKKYDNYEVEFFSDGKYRSVLSARYKLVGDDTLVAYGEYGKTKYKYEKNVADGALRLQTKGTFDVTFVLQNSVSKNVYENAYYSVTLPRNWEIREQTDFSALLIDSGQNAATIEVTEQFQYGGSTEEIVENWIGMKADIVSEDELNVGDQTWRKVVISMEESAAQEINGEMNPEEIHYFYLSDEDVFVDVLVQDTNLTSDVENVIKNIILK